MTYSTKAEAKPMLDIDPSDTLYNIELNACITSADVLIDSILPVEVSASF